MNIRKNEQKVDSVSKHVACDKLADPGKKLILPARGVQNQMKMSTSVF